MSHHEECPDRWSSLNEGGASDPVGELVVDLAKLAVTGLVIVCDLGEPPAGNAAPAMSMTMTQHLRLADGSLVRLDLDRGLSMIKGRRGGPVSWRRSAADVVAEVRALIGDEALPPDELPWDDYARAARLRGIEVDASALRSLPSAVLFSEALAEVFEF